MGMSVSAWLETLVDKSRPVHAMTLNVSKPADAMDRSKPGRKVWPMAEKAAAHGGEEMLSLAEAAQVLGISQRTAQRLLDREELKATKVGRQWRFRREDLSAYLNRERAPFAQAPNADLEQALQAAAGCLGDPEQALAGLEGLIKSAPAMTFFRNRCCGCRICSSRWRFATARAISTSSRAAGDARAAADRRRAAPGDGSCRRAFTRRWWRASNSWQR